MDPAARPLMKYVKQIPAVNSASDEVVARWDLEREMLLVSGRLVQPDACRAAVDDTPDHRPTGRDAAEGIDCFAETLRHELQHRTDAIEWWGSPRGPYGRIDSGLVSLDLDGDNVPGTVELPLGCNPLSKYSCAPFANATDTEIRAYYVGWKWPLGNANAEDWSCGELSKQWHGTKCQ